jgi:hypothetical protein
MPKLNTTIDNLELKSSKIGSSTNILPEAWTDTQYPSAKLLYLNRREAHPVGSILVTSTNANPSATIGGTWELIDKTFASKSFTKVTWTAQNNTDSSGSTVVLDGHTIQVRLSLITKVAISSSATLGKISFSDYTLSSLPHSLYGYTANSDYVIDYKIDTSGNVTVLKAVKRSDNTTTMPSGASFYIDFSLSSQYTNLKDDSCDKFYWKRTA